MRPEYLNCTACGAPTPLLGSDQLECVYCAALMDVPSNIKAPIKRFSSALRKLEQRALEFSGYPLERLSNALVLLMGLVIYGYVCWWWDTFVSSWSSLDSSTKGVLLQLLAIPPGLLVLNRLLSNDKYSPRAKLAFATLTFDITSLAKSKLSCPRCAAPLGHQEARDIVVDCRHCHCELLIPWCLVRKQLRGIFRRLMAVRGRDYHHSEFLKWLVIALTACNGIVPMVVLAGSAVESAHLVYLTGFTWSYMVNSLVTIWAYGNLGPGHALALFVVHIPLPVFFLFQLTRVLLGLDPNRF